VCIFLKRFQRIWKQHAFLYVFWINFLKCLFITFCNFETERTRKISRNR
jgi:hypothetical protein